MKRKEDDEPFIHSSGEEWPAGLQPSHHNISKEKIRFY